MSESKQSNVNFVLNVKMRDMEDVLVEAAQKICKDSFDKFANESVSDPIHHAFFQYRVVVLVIFMCFFSISAKQMNVYNIYTTYLLLTCFVFVFMYALEW